MNKDIRDQVLKALSDSLGAEPEDISEDDSLSHDLHMRASELTDLMESLQGAGLDTDGVDLTEIDTVGDLIEALGGETYLDTE